MARTLTKSTTQEQRAAEWRDRVARYGASGLDVATFCLLESVSKANFYRWRSLINDEAAMTPAGAEQHRSFIDLGQIKTPAVAAQSRPLEGAAAAGMLEVSLDLGHGLTLRITRR